MTTAAPTIVRECSRYDLSPLSDQDLLAGTRRLVGASNQLFADLLAHLAEVETRGIHRNKACASLYTYCIYELQFSEDAAFRRVSAARFVKAFPVLFEAVASGELHLTGLLMIAPHLTASNQHEVLARAKHRTKKELAKLVRELDPLPDVPARIAPLGPAAEPRTHLRSPTWAEYVASMEPVRHLKAGERPRDWVDESTIAHAFELAANANATPNASSNATVTPNANATPNATSNATVTPNANATPNATSNEDGLPNESESADVPVGASKSVAPARVVPAVTGPQRHAVQFTASQEYVDLVERAKALLSHTGGTSLEELHLRAMQCLVVQLQKRKYGAPRREVASSTDEMRLSKVARLAARNSQLDEIARDADEVVTARMSMNEQPGADAEAPDAGATDAGATDAGATDAGATDAGAANTGAIDAEERDPLARAGASSSVHSERSRNVPARIRRRVFERDGLQCTFTDESGCRCREMDRLELHHLKPFARYGQHHADNLTLRCAAHNALAAEQDFGSELIGRKRDATRHESLGSQHRLEQERDHR